MIIKRFEDILVWKEARELVKMVYRICRNAGINKDFGLKDQLQRAAVSTMANVAEGFEAKTNKEFIQFLIYTRRSCAEIQSELYAALDQSYIDENDFNLCYKQAEKVHKLANGFIRHLRLKDNSRSSLVN